MDKHYIFNIEYLTHTSFPEIGFGLLCLAATVFIIYLLVQKVKGDKLLKSPKTDEIGNSVEDNASSEIPKGVVDSRVKIQGYWRDCRSRKEFFLYPFGKTYLLEETALGRSHQPRYYTFSSSLMDDQKFYAEGSDSLTFLYDDENDCLWYMEKNMPLKRVPEWQLKIEDALLDAELEK